MIQKTSIAAVALAAIAGTAFAVDYDPTGFAGQFVQNRNADVVRGMGGSFAPSLVYVPVILDEDDGLFNSPAVQNNAALNNTPFGVWTTFGSGAAQPPVRVVGAFGTTDASNPAGGSNDVFLSEGPTGASNTIGALVRDGTLVYRANFNSGVNQNNLEVRNIMWPMNTASPTTGSPTRVFGAFSGIDGVAGGDVFLGTPGATRFNNDLFSGVTTFNGGTPTVLTGVNVYVNLGNDPLAPVDVWEADDVPLPTLPGPTPVTGEVRQTQPGVQTVNLPNGEQAVYTVFGVGFSVSSSGAPFSSGSARPIYFIVDEVNGDNFADGFAFIDADGDNDLNIANPDVRFVDHQATGGGTSVFAGRQFDMNSRGQVVAVFEDRGITPRAYEIRLFNPIFSAAGDAITGYEAPITIARSGQDGIVEDLQTVAGTPPAPAFLLPFSGVALDEAGRVAFVAVTEKFETPAPGGLIRLQNSTNDLFVWEPCTETLHSVLKGGQSGDTLMTVPGNVGLSLGVFPVDQASDGFTGAGFSDVGGHLVVAFRNNADEGGVDRDTDGLQDKGGSLRPGLANEASVRGIVTLTLGEFIKDCPTDTNNDGSTNFADLNTILSNFGVSGASVQCLDTNGDGTINFADLNAVLSAFGQPCM
ncbi:MAG: hypothetical protein ACTS27_02735 [Phycisphaerales bacterium]